jgi:WD40 repeat protein
VLLSALMLQCLTLGLIPQLTCLASSSVVRSVPMTAAVDANDLRELEADLRAAGHDNTVHIIEASTMKSLSTLKGHDRTVRAICFLSDGMRQ